jgi:hypothetical protein
MKKLIGILLAASLAGAAFAGCSEQEPQEERSMSMVRVSSGKIDPEIIGEWSNGSSGYIFKEDRMVTLPMDFSAAAHFNKDGSFSMETTTVSKDEIEYDGTALKVSHHYDEAPEDPDILLLDMKRKDAANKDSYDGTYELLGGSYRDMIAYNLAIDTDKINVEAVVEGESLRFSVIDYCSYETNGGNLELFSENMNYVDENAHGLKYTYVIEGDTLTLTYEDSEPEVLKRVK